MKPSRWVVNLPERVGKGDPAIAAKHGRRIGTRYIVLHAIAEYIDTGLPSETHQYCVDFLRGRNELPHYFITPSGIVLRGWHHSLIANHARGYNSESVGIELMLPGCWTYETFVKEMTSLTPTQFFAGVPQRERSLEKLLGELLKLYPDARLVGHEEVDPSRKVDPGYFLDLNHWRAKFNQ